METIVQADGGRVLRVEEAGDPTGAPVLMHHGTPGSGHLYGPHVLNARSRGIRLIGYDRPGYGGSTSKPGRTIADCAEDVRAIAGALGIKRMALWGISGGGPHAIACAALLPDLLVAVGSLASPAPFDAPDLDYFSGMGQENVDDTRLLLDDETAARAKLVEDRKRVLSLSPEQMAEAFPTLLSPVDVAALTPEVSRYLAGCTHDGLTPGGDGWWDDSYAMIRPWGFDVDSITVPVQLWHGRQDRFVPFQQGEWLASRIPGVEAHLTSEDGHITLLQQRVGLMHDWLLEHF